MNWPEKRIGDVVTLMNGYPFQSEGFTIDRGPRVVRIRDLTDDSDPTHYSGPDEHRAQINTGDVLVGMDGDFNVVMWRGGTAVLNQRLCCLRSKAGTDMRFVAYALPAHLKQVNDLTYATAVKHLSSRQIRQIRFPCPSPAVQSSVADFLDRKTAAIDDVLRKKERLIELLEEKRQALIARAVATGIVDDSVATSGTPAAEVARGATESSRRREFAASIFGILPVHWNVVKFGAAVAISEGQVNPRAQEYESMPLIAPNHIESMTGRLLALESASDQNAISGKYRVRSGDVLYSKIRPALRKVAIAPTKGLCSADMYPMRFRNDGDQRYLKWLLLSESFARIVVLFSDRVAMPKVNRDTLCALPIPLPPTDEQRRISDYLDEKMQVLATLIQHQRRTISLLMEYRQSIIAAAVTGTLDINATEAA